MARVMLHILSQSQFSTLRSHFEAQHQPATHDWHDPANQNAANVTYRQWKDGLIAAVRAHFPVQCDHAKVSACMQHEDENVEGLLDRLQTAYDNHSGITKPDGFPQGDMTSPNSAASRKRRPKKKKKEKIKSDAQHRAQLHLLQHASFPQAPAAAPPPAWLLYGCLPPHLTPLLTMLQRTHASAVVPMDIGQDNVQ
ncbi:uncharacterized protein LOC118598298 isoform X3 [Oryzias melastigma]|uniref:uncharacterized protein LOC118598298 isoform X3 n=1 Tax=Oryzias melastigma TaxID=30732 RepID=UPI00168D55EF|nr:uncharacterized protein LOC118598298 isoform X3 [Oryzias melastigma]